MEFKLTQKAEEAANELKRAYEADDYWDIADEITVGGTSDGFWYDMTSGGSIKLNDILSDLKQIGEVERAVELLQEFEEHVYNKITPEY